MTTLRLSDLQHDYRGVLAWVVEQGDVIAPRGVKTRELRGVELVISRPMQTLPLGVGRKLNPAIAAVESLQLMGGVSHPELMVKATANFTEFMDGGIFHGAYGPRVRNQVPIVHRLLRQDPATRQAVIAIWDPAYDLHGQARDLPCTIALQFMIRDQHLELHTHMRSNDAWRGLAYDAFVFTQLQVQVAASLGVRLGKYHHHVVSLHLYERDLDAVNELLLQEEVPEPFELGPLLDYKCDANEFMRVARDLLSRETVETSPTIEWYRARLP